MKIQRTPIASAVGLLLMGAILPVHAQPAPAPGAADPKKLETVIVTGIRASREASLNAKRDSDTVEDVITAEDIGKMPDKNVADAIQRLPGVNIASSAGGEGGFDENDRVSIRGTSPSLTQTLLNGHAISTGDWFVLNLFGTTVGRSVSYSLLPAGLISKVSVKKSSTADLPEGGVAGNVNIETRHPLDFRKRFTAEAHLQAVHSDLAKKTDPQISALFGVKNDAGTAGGLLQVFSETRNLRRDGQEILGYFTTPTTGAWATANPTLAGKLMPSLIGNALFEQERKREGAAFEVQFKPNDATTLGVNALFSKMSAKNMNTNFMASPKWLVDAGVSPTSATLSSDGTTIVSAQFPIEAAANSYINDSGIRPGAGSESSNVTIDGKWRATDRFTLTGQLGTTKGKGKSKEYASEVGNGGRTPLALMYSFNGLSRGPDVAFTGGDATQYSSAQWNWNFGAKVEVVDKEDYATIDGEWALDSGILESVKFGARITDHSRNNGKFIASGPNWANPNITTTLPAWSGTTYPSNFGSAFGAPLPGIWRLTYQDVENWASESTVANPNPNATFNYDPAQRHQWTNDFDTREKTQAIYALANFDGPSWRANAGVRIVRTQQRAMTTRNPTPTDDPSVIDSTSLFGPFVTEFVTRNYTDVLPSANIKFNLSKDIVLRAAVARTMARPDYTALSSSTTTNDQLNSGSAGNPNLNPVRSTNLDATAEWYFAPKSIASVGIFHQRFSSFVKYEVVQRTLWNDLRQQQEVFNLTTPINVGARNTGIEFGFQTPIAGNFGINANYTYADGKTNDGGEMAGNSKHTYNLEGWFENDRLSARLAYTYRSEFLAGLDRSSQLHADATGNLAGSINYKINDTFTLTFDALNLNNPTLKYYANTKEQPRAFYSNGRQFYFGIRAKI